MAWLRLLGAAHLGIWHITKSDADFDKGDPRAGGRLVRRDLHRCAEMIPPQGLPDYGGGEPNPSKAAAAAAAAAAAGAAAAAAARRRRSG